KNEAVLKFLKHPVNKVGFRDMNTPVVWPDDSFTARRIRDGDVSADAPAPETKKKKETPPEQAA
ncbi:MAG TPA: hypothetical protein VH593_33715, partial [Ktedonobacteraceae bacterium]